METRMPPVPPIRPDVVGVESAPRPTPTPVRVRFSEVLSVGAGELVRGAEAMAKLPGAPLMAVALRGGGGGRAPAGVQAGVGGGIATGATGVTLAPEGPGGIAQSGGLGVGVGGGVAGAGGAGDGGVESSLAQAQEMNLYYLQIQEQVNAQNREFTTLSNVLKAEHDTVKNAIGNIR